MKKFDTYVQQLKYQVLKEVIKKAYNDDLINCYKDIPKTISPGPKPIARCCIYKDRAVIEERIALALGGDKNNPNSVEVIDVACDECPAEGVFVTPACRGCLVHRCAEVCPKGAITIVNHKAMVDKEKCVECGMCTKACPYSAIIMQKRPCINSCKVGAISIDENKKAKIDNDKCISCGACVYQCPFGAISDKSFILETIDILRKSENNKNYKVYAVIAPSIAGQFDNANPHQVVTAIMKLGFHQVVEAALGADITLYHEAKEFKEKGEILNTSCSPSFVMYIEKHFPELTKYISSSVSPMVHAAMLIKRNDPTGKVIFIGPCTSKKMEYKLEKTQGAIDSVISFEELQAFFDAKDINLEEMEETPLDNASFYGRIFAKSGGIKEGITKVASDMGVTDISPIAMNGIDECKVNLLKLKMGKALNNFFEGMACDGGCLNGALCIHHGPKNVAAVDKFGKEAREQDISNSVKLYKMGKED